MDSKSITDATQKMCEIFKYYISGRADPDCALGHILKALFKNDDFMNKLVISYIMSTREDFELNCTAARLLLNVMPGLESAMVFQDTVSVCHDLESIIEKGGSHLILHL